MRPSPPLRVCIREHGAWRAGLAALIVVALAVQAAWLHGRASDLDRSALLLLAALDITVLGIAVRALHPAAVFLRWDTRCWWLQPADDTRASPVPGRLAVALDLGAWMLLVFRAEAGPAPRGPRTTWLPVQRRGLEAHWHALRCAVYCARPAPTGGAAPDAGPEPKE